MTKEYIVMLGTSFLTWYTDVRVVGKDTKVQAQVRQCGLTPYTFTDYDEATRVAKALGGTVIVVSQEGEENV